MRKESQLSNLFTMPSSPMFKAACAVLLAFQAQQALALNATEVIGRAGPAPAKKLRVWLVSQPMSPLEGILRLAVEMKDRGHDVMVGTTDKAENKVKKRGLNFLNLGKHPLTLEFEHELMGNVSKSTGGVLAVMRIAKPLFDGINDAMFEGLRAQFAAGVRLPEMMVCAMSTTSCAEFAAEHNITFIWSAPIFGALMPVISNMPYIPSIGFGFPYLKMTTLQRIMNFVPLLFVKVIFPIVGWPNAVMQKTVELTKGRLILVPGVPGLDYPQHLAPLVQYTGPYLTAKDAEQSLLSVDMKVFLDTPKAPPVMYISMGTVVQLSRTLCLPILEAIREGYAAGEFRAMWALPAHQEAECLGEDRAADLVKSGALFHSAWIHTPAALSHPSVRVFLSHCGANGATESVWAKVPVLGMPFFGDQPENVNRLQDLDLGLRLDKNRLTASDIREGARLLVTDPRYAKAAHKVGNLMRAYGGVARAADFVEAAAEVQDLGFLETPVEKLGVLNAFCLDILLGAAVLLSGCCFLGGRWSARRCHRDEGHMKKD